MKAHKVTGLFLYAVFLLQPIAIFGFETDQYNLPPSPLADIGSEVSEYVSENLSEAVSKLNREISARENCLASKSSGSKCGSTAEERSKLDFLRSEDAAAKAVYNRLGIGFIPFTKSQTWINSHKFINQPARYTSNFCDSIHALLPTSYITISPTVNLYGSQFGTDKIAHIFQQGYDYYRIYKRALAKGLTAEQAAKKAVEWGRRTERTYFGTWVSGVYSNADLAANYIGWKFYLGLTRDIAVGNVVRPAILVVENGKWKIRKKIGADEILLKPLISGHLNEADNPSKISNILGLRSYVRRVVRKKVCRQWFDRDPHLSQENLRKTAKSLELWHGEDYGFSASENFVTIAGTCFDTNAQPNPDPH